MFFQVIAFYVLTLVSTFLLGGIQGALAFSSQVVILPQLAPGLGALLILLIFRRDQIQLSIVNPKVPWSRYLLSALVPAGGALVIFLINHYTIGGGQMSGLSALPWQLTPWMPLGALGEELGWRGYLHKRVDPAVSGLLSSILVGAFWGVWHVGLYANGFIYMAYFLLLMISYSVVIYSLVVDVAFNLLPAAIFHLMINLTNLVFLDVINEVAFMRVNSLVWADVAVGAVLYKRAFFLGSGKKSGM